VCELNEVEAARSCAIRRAHEIRAMHLGSNGVLAAVGLDFDDSIAARVEQIIVHLERSICQRYPIIQAGLPNPANTDQDGSA
jgi:hypothetical protein